MSCPVGHARQTPRQRTGEKPLKHRRTQNTGHATDGAASACPLATHTHAHTHIHTRTHTHTIQSGPIDISHPVQSLLQSQQNVNRTAAWKSSQHAAAVAMGDGLPWCCERSLIASIPAYLCWWLHKFSRYSRGRTICVARDWM